MFEHRVWAFAQLLEAGIGPTIRANRQAQAQECTGREIKIWEFCVIYISTKLNILIHHGSKVDAHHSICSQ